MLFAAANRTLDATTEELERERVYREVERFLLMKQLASDRCLDSTVFPRSADGERDPRNNSCLYRATLAAGMNAWTSSAATRKRGSSKGRAGRRRAVRDEQTRL